MIENSESKKKTSSSAAIIAIVATTIYLIANIIGEGIGGSLAANPSCLKYFGCTAGFFGFDAVEHFLFGVAGTFVLIFIFQKFPKYSILSDKRWKNILIIIALIALISVLWELLEFAHDIIRIDILHQALVNWRLNINLLDQPSNFDTMGDLTFGLLGSVITLIFAKFPGRTD